MIYLIVIRTMLDRSDIHHMAKQLKVWSSWYYLLLNLTGCSSQQMVYHLKSFFSVNHSAAVKIHQPVKSPAIAMKSSQVLSVVDQKNIKWQNPVRITLLRNLWSNTTNPPNCWLRAVLNPLTAGRNIPLHGTQ